MNDSDVFYTDMVGGEDGCNGCNSARFVNNITVNNEFLFDTAKGTVRNRIPVVVCAVKEVIKLLGITGF